MKPRGGNTYRPPATSKIFNYVTDDFRKLYSMN